MTIFIIFLVFSVIIGISNGDNEQSNKMNVGTVLFTESDNTKDCWSTENIALLTSRMMLEDLLPSKEVLNVKDSAFVTDIIDYFRLVLEVVRKVTYGKTRHIMLLALTDTLGGYLNRFVIPIAKRAYYAGYIDFDSMDRLYQLFEELKCFLRTNGHGWATPIKEFSNKMDAQPLPIQSPAPKTDPCKGLIVFEKASEGGHSKTCPVGIPMPFFDSKTHPSSIAIPFKTYSLRNIESKSASYVLVKFYMAATKCLAMRNANKNSMDEFNVNFYTWIHNQVSPHLNDDKFYSAFGGVLRIEETLARMGTMRSNSKEMGNYNIMPEQQVKEYSKETADDATKRKKSNLILMALLATIFIWFLLGSLFICYRIKAARNRTEECYCGKPEPKSSTTSRSSKPSRRSSKVSKFSSKLFGSSGEKSSKKPSRTSTGFSRSKKTTSSGGGASPGRTGESPRSTASVASGRTNPSERSPASGRASPAPSGGSKHSTSSVATEKSTSSGSSRGPDNNVLKKSTASQNSGRSDASGESQQSKSVQRTPEVSKQSSKTSSNSRAGPRPPPADGSARQKPMYPASCACHTSMTGKYRMTSSSEEQIRRKETELPFVFGYELETSSESSPRDNPSEDMADYAAMSK